jgi:hypothetical protein
MQKRIVGKVDCVQLLFNANKIGPEKINNIVCGS